MLTYRKRRSQKTSLCRKQWKLLIKFKMQGAQAIKWRAMLLLVLMLLISFVIAPLELIPQRKRRAIKRKIWWCISCLLISSIITIMSSTTDYVKSVWTNLSLTIHLVFILFTYSVAHGDSLNSPKEAGQLSAWIKTWT